MVCTFYSSGYADKGNFYSAQLDSLLIDRIIGDSNCLAVPYTANQDGGNDWVDVLKGFSSSCAWYIFAKRGFNPFTFVQNLPTNIKDEKPQKFNLNLNHNFPNPFNISTTISFTVTTTQPVEIIIFDILGNKIRNLFNGYAAAGINRIKWNGRNNQGQIVKSGTYFYRIIFGKAVFDDKMVLSK